MISLQTETKILDIPIIDLNIINTFTLQDVRKIQGIKSVENAFFWEFSIETYSFNFLLFFI